MASRSWNRVELIGNLTRDPELRFTPNGAAVCTFGMATNRTYVSEGERKEEVDFHKLVAWNKLAELCNQLLKKGMRVFISGRLQTRSWEAQDGTTRQTTEIVIEDMIILTPKSNGDMGTPSDYSDLSTQRPTPQAAPPVSAKPSQDEIDKPEKVVVKEEKDTQEAAKEEQKAADEDSSKTSKQTPKEDVEDDLPF